MNETLQLTNKAAEGGSCEVRQTRVLSRHRWLQMKRAAHDAEGKSLRFQRHFYSTLFIYCRWDFELKLLLQVNCGG